MVTQGRNWESRKKINLSAYDITSQIFYDCNRLYIRKVGLELYIHICLHWFTGFFRRISIKNLRRDLRQSAMSQNPKFLTH